MSAVCAASRNYPKFFWVEADQHMVSEIVFHVIRPESSRKLLLISIYNNLKMGESRADDSYDVLFKIIAVGDSGVGKTNLIQRYAHNTFSSNTRTTIGASTIQQHVHACLNYTHKNSSTAQALTLRQKMSSLTIAS